MARKTKTAALVTAVLLTGCSLTIATVRPEDGCTQTPPILDDEGVNLVFCGDVAFQEEWIEQVPVLANDMDAVLADLWMDPVSDHLPGTLIRIYDFQEGGNKSGEYKGYTEVPTKTIELHLSGNGNPRASALVHEWYHLYDHHELGVDSLDEWYDNVVANGNHFLNPIIANHVIRKVRDPTAITALEEKFAGDGGAP